MKKTTIQLISIVAMVLLCYNVSMAYTIEGTVKTNNHWKKTIYLIKSNSVHAAPYPLLSGNCTGTIIDSAIIGNNGNFKFTGEKLPYENAFYRLNFVEQADNMNCSGKLIHGRGKYTNYIILILNSSSTIKMFIDEEDINRYYTFSIASEENRSIKELTKLLEPRYNVENQMVSIMSRVENDNKVNKDSLMKAAQ